MIKRILAIALLFSVLNVNAQRVTSPPSNDGKNLAIGLGLLGGLIMNAMSKPITAGSPPVQLWIAMQAMGTYKSAYDKKLDDAKKTGVDYFESIQQWACNKGLNGDSFVPLNKYTFQTVSENKEAMRAPEGMTLEQCVVILGGRVEDMDTPAKARAREDNRQQAIAQAKATAEAAELARAEAKAKTDQEAKIAAEEAARKFEEERPAREAAQRKADADLKASNEREQKEREVAQRKAEADAKAWVERNIRESKERELAQKIAQAKRIAGLKNGTIVPTSVEDFKLKHGDVPNGAVFGSAPKIRPDERSYFIAGVVKLADEGYAVMVAQQDDNAALASAFMRSQGLESSTPKYVIVRFPKGTVRAKFMQTGQIEGKTLVYGRYIDNDTIKLVSGQTVQVPVFEADAVY